ncbi:hypothetical protein M885DRAFT_519298 [Pelagophyceae sp. CCMP2097]|nr:hypothetical protein M885DRAFT_519298 [Pelagophyceae sp. CCMP2097]|mmetsp:Transcript_23756/g.81138  ORF Transcript_23756/g.81138 Transcript_23756/m.81138 type:complete len:146 (+) Transcript_23756:87-524(+)
MRPLLPAPGRCSATWMLALLASTRALSLLPPAAWLPHKLRRPAPRAADTAPAPAHAQLAQLGGAQNNILKMSGPPLAVPPEPRKAWDPLLAISHAADGLIGKIGKVFSSPDHEMVVHRRVLRGTAKTGRPIIAVMPGGYLVVYDS